MVKLAFISQHAEQMNEWRTYWDTCARWTGWILTRARSRTQNLQAATVIDISDQINWNGLLIALLPKKHIRVQQMKAILIKMVTCVHLDWVCSSLSWSKPHSLIYVKCMGALLTAARWRRMSAHGKLFLFSSVVTWPTIVPWCFFISLVPFYIHLLCCTSITLA